MKNIIFFLLFSISIFAQKTELKSGDLLFININCGGMCDAINAVTNGYKNNDFNHMGLVVATAKNEYYVYEAIGTAVVKTPLKDFLAYTNKPVYVGSLKKKYRLYLNFMYRIVIVSNSCIPNLNSALKMKSPYRSLKYILQTYFFFMRFD